MVAYFFLSLFTMPAADKSKSNEMKKELPKGTIFFNLPRSWWLNPFVAFWSNMYGLEDSETETICVRSTRMAYLNDPNISSDRQEQTL